MEKRKIGHGIPEQETPLANTVPEVKLVTAGGNRLLDSVISIDRESFGETTLTPWTLELFVRFGKVYCVIVGDEVVGFAAFMKSWDEAHHAYLAEMAIRPQWQQKGYGSLLLRRCLDMIAAEGVCSVSLHVDPLNIAALHVYQDKLGFRFIEYRANEYGAGNDRILMQRDLVPGLPQGGSTRSLPWRFDPGDELAMESSKDVSKHLRNVYFQNAPLNKASYTAPLFGKLADDTVRESLGPFPEFILTTYPCANTLAGYCVPCFYSKMPRTGLGRLETVNSLIVQTKYIVDNFQEIVEGYQKGTENSLHRRWDAIMCYATMGSFFSNAETSRDTRLRSLDLLANYAESRGLNLLTYIETCGDDLLQAYESGEMEVLTPLLRKLNAVMLCGLESVNDYVRQVVYMKRISLAEFERVVHANRKAGLATGAFVFTGFHSMTQKEIIQDVEKTLVYLRRMNVMPVLMFPNLQEYTLPHLLYLNGKYDLIDPRTAARLVDRVLSIFDETAVIANHPWLMSDPYGGPPPPRYCVFTNANRISCTRCTDRIREAIDDLRKSLDSFSFRRTLADLAECDRGCEDKYREYIEAEHSRKSGVPLRQRVSANLAFAKNLSEHYLETLKG